MESEDNKRMKTVGGALMAAMTCTLRNEWGRLSRLIKKEGSTRSTIFLKKARREQVMVGRWDAR